MRSVVGGVKRISGGITGKKRESNSEEEPCKNLAGIRNVSDNGLLESVSERFLSTWERGGSGEKEGWGKLQHVFGRKESGKGKKDDIRRDPGEENTREWLHPASGLQGKYFQRRTGP